MFYSFSAYKHYIYFVKFISKYFIIFDAKDKWYHFFFMYFKQVLLGEKHLGPFFQVNLFIMMIYISFSLVIFALQYNSSSINIDTPALLWLFQFIFFLIFTFNLSVSLYWKEISYRQLIFWILFFYSVWQSLTCNWSIKSFTFNIVIDIIGF